MTTGKLPSNYDASGITSPGVGAPAEKPSIVSARLRGGARSGILWGALATAGTLAVGALLLYAGGPLAIAGAAVANMTGAGFTMLGIAKVAGVVGGIGAALGFARGASDDNIAKDIEATHARMEGMKRVQLNRQLAMEQQQMQSMGIGAFAPNQLPRLGNSPGHDIRT